MDLALRIRRNARAKRIKLRLDAATGDAVLTLPPGVARAEGIRFANQHRAWLEAGRAALPSAVSLAPGAVLPLFGEDHHVDHQPSIVGIHRDPAAVRIVAGGPLENFEARLEAWLKIQARRHLADRVDHFTGRIGRPVQRLRVGDPKSRWGSYSTTGTLSLSWRLVFAPLYVSDYVVAHEVAHMMELNHSRRFWRAVEELVGDTTAPRDWLKRHGAALHRIGGQSS